MSRAGWRIKTESGGGRDALGLGELWNSNSVGAWLRLVSGHAPAGPPDGGRAPGWDAGLVIARRDPRSSRTGRPHAMRPSRGELCPLGAVLGGRGDTS